MDYQDTVAAAATALQQGEDANWTLARLTDENTRDNGGGPQPGKVTMEVWCGDVFTASRRQFTVRTGERYKAIWREHGPTPVADRPSWTAAWNQVLGDRTPEDRKKELLRTHIRNATPEVKREAFQRLIEDPEVINRETITEAGEVFHARQREVLHMPPVPTPNLEQVEARQSDRRGGLAHVMAASQLELYLNQAYSAAERFREVLRTMGDLSDLLKRAEIDAIEGVIAVWTENRDLLVDGAIADEVDAYLRGRRGRR
jgi:hypothetical protein